MPFLTDANTLYAGTRSDTLHHLTTAIQNGFAYAVVEAPLVIADGLRGKSEVPVSVYGKHFESTYIAQEIVEADALISVAHFKGHELTGFGGAKFKGLYPKVDWPLQLEYAEQMGLGSRVLSY